ncbi:MAG: DUF2911 domain-containing protein [Bacteroidia bacterium]|nr:DUF2911 domain-containing protein [Bacteroidia bacterium]MDP5170120.1 DUF2911 domain-containing protein [Bacteroidia bacterium]
MNKYLLSICLMLALGFVACEESGSSTVVNSETVIENAEAMAPVANKAVISTIIDSIASPRRQLYGTMDNVVLTINYGSPAMKGRQVWGELVPFDEIWRTGANEATSFEVADDVMIGDQKLRAGKYGLFTIPGENDWTLIFNSVSDQWGAYQYDESKDVLRTKVVPVATETASETMEFEVDGDNVVILWDKLAVPFSVTRAK